MQLSIEVNVNWNLLNTPTSSSTVAQLQAQFGFGMCEDITYALSLTPLQCSYVSMSASTTTQYSSTIPGVTVVVDMYATDATTLNGLFSKLQAQATTPDSLLLTGYATQSIPSSASSIKEVIAPQTSSPNNNGGSSSSSSLSMGIIIAIAAGGAVLLIAVVVGVVCWCKKGISAQSHKQRLQNMSTISMI